MRRQLRQLAWAARRLPRWAGAVGWLTAARIALAEPLTLMRARAATFELPLPGRNGRVTLRTDSSDFEAFVHVFVDGAFEHVPFPASPRRIVDCGANVGFSAIDLLHRFPDAHVVAVEPDAGNFEALQANLRGFADRATLLKAGIWSHDGRGTRDLAPWRDGREWSVKLREAEGTGGVALISMATLLDRAGWENVDFMKVDIEGAELHLFGGADTTWLEHVKVLAVELHDEACRQAFYRAIGRFRAPTSQVGELTVVALGA